MEQLKPHLSSLHAPIESQVFSSYLLHLSQKGRSLLLLSLTPYPVLPDEIGYDAFKFYFHTPTVPSRVVTFELKVLDVERYPHQHSIRINLCSPLPLTAEDSKIKDVVSMVPKTSKTVQEALDAVAPVLASSLGFHINSFDVPGDKTYVVSVLGSANFADHDWFLADYCLLYKALGGTAKQEVWLTCGDIRGFVNERGPVLHGCPYRTPRRVVLHDDSSDTFTQFVDPSTLADKFIQCLQSTAQAATPGEQILIVMVGHGSYFGDVELGSSSVSRDMVELALVGTKEGVEVTVVTTACYSGLWAIPFKNSRATVLSAGGGPNVSTAGSGLIDELSSVAQGLRISSDLPVPTFGSTITQTISLQDINSGATNDSAFKPYVARVIARLQNQRTTPAAVSFSGRSDVGHRTVEVPGGSGNLSALLRVGAVLDLPQEAEFSSVGLAVSNLFPQQQHKTAAGANESVHAACARLLLEQWSRRTPGSLQMSRNASISKFCEKAGKGEFVMMMAANCSDSGFSVASDLTNRRSISSIASTLNSKGTHRTSPIGMKNLRAIRVMALIQDIVPF